MNKFKLSPNTILILIILGMVLIATFISTIVDFGTSGIASIQAYRNKVLPLLIVDIAGVLLILFMCWRIFSMVKKIIATHKWNDRFFTTIKQIGWLSILVLLLQAISLTFREKYIAQGKNITEAASDTRIYSDILSQALFASPLIWFLIGSIFLLADALQHINNTKSVKAN
ncbi:MAG: hypothetical protein ACK5NK_08850 [Niabella sp.]